MKEPTVMEDFSDMMEGFIGGMILWGSVGVMVLFSLCTLTQVLDFAARIM